VRGVVNAGVTCLGMHNEIVRDVQTSKVQCDEIWSFCFANEKNISAVEAAPNGAGNVLTWTAIDADTKLMVSYFVGDRSDESAMFLMDDLRARLANRVELTTDGHGAYLEAAEEAFGYGVD
jgi:hypothetical protein